VFVAALAFVVTGLAGGLVVPPASLPLADTLNYSTFFAVTGVPVHVIRAAAALGIAYFVVRVLRVFGVEFERRLEAAQLQERLAQSEALGRPTERPGLHRSLEPGAREQGRRAHPRTGSPQPRAGSAELRRRVRQPVA